MILLIDNYDSFVHNLARYVRRLGHSTQVIRNDRLSIDEIRRMNPTAIVISPGPCTPNEAGATLDVIRGLAGEFRMLGVCLGHQAIVQAFGGKIVRGVEPVHGRTSLIYHDGSSLYAGVDNPFVAARYHSLVAQRDNLPECLRIRAWTDEGVIMGVEHDSLPIVGVQFHPESVLTRDGQRILENFFDGASLARSLP